MNAAAEHTHGVREALKQRGSTVVRIQGQSMQPTLRTGMRVEVQPVEFEALRPGDLLVFSNGREIICRRLIRKRGRICHTRGDANLWIDPPVIWSQVLGKVTRVIDNDYRIHAMEGSSRRGRDMFIVRFGIYRALFYRLRRQLKRLRWWQRGIEWDS